MEKNQGNNGITLIALVVTIIILIILAGISISMLTSQNGILTRTIEAKEKTELANEKEVIEQKIIQFQMEEKIDSHVEPIGTRLQDKTIENGNKWNVIYLKNKNQIYGTGWYYLKKNK